MGEIIKFDTFEEMMEYLEKLPKTAVWEALSDLPNKGDYSVEVK